MAFGREHRIDKVLMILDTTTTIAMGAEVARQLSVPLLSLVWDAPEYFLVGRKWDRFTRNKLLARFGETLGLSEKVAVVSETMQKDYKKKYGARTVIVRHGLRMEDSIEQAARFSTPTDFVIGFAGGLYALSAWEALLQALAECDWHIAGRQVVLKVLGWNFHFRTKKKMNIHFLGWRSPEEAAAILAGCNVNYLPHPFEPELYHLAHYSFPTKMSTYLAAGRPVFVHAPPQSSLTPFCTRNQVGMLCESLDPAEIIAGLKKLASDQDYYSESARQVFALTRTEFNKEHFLRSFAEFIGIAS
ncbi:MAG: glycosyltransferase [Desulfobacterales bacterium]|nr:glycosyltransferase [Desulfobacterales bacterium]